MKKKWLARREINKLDAFCRKIIFARDGDRCKRCGKGKDQVCLHWSHFISRNKKSVRWDLRNSCVLCYFCHFRWAHEQPLAYAVFIRHMIGDEEADALTLRGNKPQPLSPDVVEVWWAYLRAEAKKYGIESDAIDKVQSP